MRIHYEIMEDLVVEIIQLMVLSSNEDVTNNLFQLYLEYLSECGWTDQEFDAETLSRIDSSWETPEGEFIKYWH